MYLLSRPDVRFDMMALGLGELHFDLLVRLSRRCG